MFKKGIIEGRPVKIVRHLVALVPYVKSFENMFISRIEGAIRLKVSRCAIVIQTEEMPKSSLGPGNIMSATEIPIKNRKSFIR